MRYITGLGRGNNDYGLLNETHLYAIEKTPKGEAYKPMCSRGFNRWYGTNFSIWRGNSSAIGCCQVCEGRAAKGLKGLGWKLPRKTKKRIAAAEKRDRHSPLFPWLPLMPDPKYFPEDQWDLTDEDGLNGLAIVLQKAAQTGGTQ
jgi:hypothetical protein